MHKLLFGLFSAVALLTSPALADMEIETRTISGGARLWVSEDNALPVVTIRMQFHGGGSASDPQGKEGRAVVAATMLMEGAGVRDALAFKQALAEKAIELSIHADSDDLVVNMRSLRTHVPDALKLLAEALAQPRFDPEAVDRVKRQHIAQLVNLQQNADYQANKALEKGIFQGHPYASDGLGTKASIRALTVDDLRSYQQTVIAAERADVVVTGALAMTDARALLRAFFAGMPEKTLEYTPIPNANLQIVASPRHITMPLPQSSIRMALPWVSRDHEDFYPAYVLQMALGGGVLRSVLGDVLRREQGLVYDVGTSLSLREAASYMRIHAATRNMNANDVINRIQEVLSDVQQHGIAHTRCEETKQYIIGSLPLMIDSTGGLASMLSMMQREKMGVDYLEKRAGLFASVSCDAVNQLAARLLDPQKLSIVVAGGKSEAPSEAPSMRAR